MFGVNRPALFWGILFVILGIAFLLNNFGLVPRDLFNLWPLVVVGAGLWMLGRSVQRRRGQGLAGGVVILALGAFWQLENWGVVNDQAFLPVLVIALGAGLLLRSLFFPD